MENKSLSIVIPCYNEEKNIPLIFEKIQHLVSNRIDTEIILVNNGSTDNSKEVLSNLVAGNKNIKVCDIPVNKGYGYGILQGLLQTNGNILAWTHADMQTDPMDILTAYDLYIESLKNSESDIFIKGKRMNRNKFDDFFTWGMQIIASILLNERLDDINAQPKLFSRKFYKSIADNAPYDFSLDLYFLYHAQKTIGITEIPVIFANREFGEAKGGGTLRGKYKLILRTMKYMIELRKNLRINNK